MNVECNSIKIQIYVSLINILTWKITTEAMTMGRIMVVGTLPIDLQFLKTFVLWLTAKIFCADHVVN